MASNSCSHMLDQKLFLTPAQAEITDKIIQELSQGLLQISENPKPFLRQQPPHQDHKINLIKQIRESKHKTLQELHELQEKQLQLRKAILKLSKSRSKSKTPEKSSFTSEEKHKIIKILRKKKKKQESDRQKHESILESFQRQMRQQEEEKLRKIEMIKEQHHLESEKRLSDLSVKQKTRRQTNDEAIKRIKELRSRKYLFKIHEKEDEKKRNEEQQFKKQRLKEVHEKFKLNLEEIKEHSKRVKTIEEEKESLRRQKMNQITESRRKSYVKYEPSSFMKVLAEEEEEKKVMESRREQKPQQFKQKIKQFNSYVRENFKPERQSSSPLVTLSMPKKRTNTLSMSQRNKEGNQFLQIAKKRRKQKDDMKIVTEPQIVRYKNYLQHFQRHENKNKTTDKFKSLVNSSSFITEYERVEKANNMIGQMEAKSKKSKDAKVIESIRHKLDILKALG